MVCCDLEERTFRKIKQEQCYNNSMSPEERMQAWKSIKDPKPTWEVFKRLLSSSNNDVQKALKMWEKKNSRRGTVI